MDEPVFLDEIISELQIQENDFSSVFGFDFMEYFEEELKNMHSDIKSVTIESLWSCLLSLEDGIHSFDKEFLVIDFLCQAGPISTFGIQRIELIENFFSEYHNITKEQLETSDEFFEFNPDAIESLINTFTNVREKNIFDEISHFLIVIAQKSVASFTDVIPFYVEKITSLIPQNEFIYLNFLLNFIDSIEGRIECSKYSYKIFKYPKRTRNLRIIVDEDEVIDIFIDPVKTSLYSIRNVISAIEQVPLDSFIFDVDELNDDVKSITLSDSGNANMDPSDFDAFPSNILSKNEVFVKHVFDKLGNHKISVVLLKILHRLQLPGYQKVPSFFIESLSDPNAFPAHYQYVTEFILFHFIGYSNKEYQFELSMEMKPRQYNQFRTITQILFENLIESRFMITYQKCAIEILRLFINNVFFDNDQFFDLLRQFIHYPQCINLVFLLAQFIELNKSDLNLIAKSTENTLLKKLVLEINERSFKAIEIILRNLNGKQAFNFLISDIFNHPDKYERISTYIQKLTRILLSKYPSIVQNIIKLPEEKFIENPCQIKCDELNEMFKIMNFEATDLLLLYFHASLDKNDLSLKKSVYRFLDEIPDTDNLKISVIMSIIDQEFQIGEFDLDTFEAPIRCFNGLTNSGCTCYINCILQQLNSIDLFYEKLIADPNDDLRPDIQYLKLLFSHLRYNQEESSFNSSEYCELYQQFNPDFNVYQQQDADEYLHQLFDNFPSETIKVFEGKLLNIIQDASNDVSQTEEAFMTIPLNIKDHSDLHSSLENYLKHSPVYQKDENQNLRRSNGSENIVAIRRVRLVKLPDVLIFHLHRFEYSFESDQENIKKINSYFAFPTALNMDDFAESDDGDDEQFGIYKLKGAVVHTGNAIGGHYTSIIRCNFNNSNLETEGKKSDNWMLFNDTSVSEISELDLFEITYGDVEENSCQNAYILFYEKEQRQIVTE